MISLRREEVLRESECVWEKERDITYKRERTWLEEVRVLCVYVREREREREIEKEGYNTQTRERGHDSYSSFEEYTLLCWFICFCSGMVSSSLVSRPLHIFQCCTMVAR